MATIQYFGKNLCRINLLKTLNIYLFFIWKIEIKSLIYNVLFLLQDNLRRFKKETYPFKRKDEIVNFFANFENYWTEDQMWTKSEKIKPRGKKSK